MESNLVWISACLNAVPIPKSHLPIQMKKGKSHPHFRRCQSGLPDNARPRNSRRSQDHPISTAQSVFCSGRCPQPGEKCCNGRVFLSCHMDQMRRSLSWRNRSRTAAGSAYQHENQKTEWRTHQPSQKKKILIITPVFTNRILLLCQQKLC
jgi:hypothetical protein